MRRALLVLLAIAPVAGAFLLSNSRVGNGFVYEFVPSQRLPIGLLVDTEPVPGVADPRAVAQSLMDDWNAVPEAADVFGAASPGGAYNGPTAGTTFGVFNDSSREIAFDADGQILAHFGLSAGVLGITLKSVDTNSGQILDLLVVINTQPGALTAPGSGATTEELFRSTLLHELGHATGIGHTPCGLANSTTFGLATLTPDQIPTMWPFRLPLQPQAGASLERDDEAALIRNYPSGTAGLGSISGRVRGASGGGINEIAVRAVGPEGSPEEHVGIFTNVDGTGQGNFTIPFLRPGGYRVILETVNGRGGAEESSFAGNGTGLGSNLFIYAGDEFWEPGDTYDPSVDPPGGSAVVQVREGRDTGSLDFVLNAAPILAGGTANGSFVPGDAQFPDTGGGFHFCDYFLFQGSSGQAVTIQATGAGTTPQLRLLRPLDYSERAEAAPLAGSAVIDTTLDRTGIHTILCVARATTGNPGGTGAYALTLDGAGGALPAPPAVAPASLAAGPESPGARGFSSPVCNATLLQLRFTAPSHEELWIDALRLRAGGSGNDALDVDAVRLARDLNGDGVWQPSEPVLATGSFSGNDGSLTFGALGLELNPGSTLDLIVLHDISFPAAAGLSVPVALALAALAFLSRRRIRAGALALLLALVPLSCGGGGGGCNGELDPAGIVTTYTVRVDPGDVTAFTPTRAPGSPLPLPPATIASSTLSVSH